MSDIVEKLRSFAARESEMSRSMAEAKSLRQADNPSGECVYSWLKPEETLSGQAAETILALRAEVEALRGMLAKTRSAISSLNEGAMGYGAPPFMSIEDQIRHQWPLRDELIAEIDAALSTTEAKA